MLKSERVLIDPDAREATNYHRKVLGVRKLFGLHLLTFTPKKCSGQYICGEK